MSNIGDDFHVFYEQNRLWEKQFWLGAPILKLPFDLIIIQELIFKIRPDYIIETGTGFGGSALFYASIAELIGKGRIITVDIEDKLSSSIKAYNLFKNRIIQFIGSSTDENIYNSIKAMTFGKKNIVLLDSWHSKEHVLKELNLYSKLVPIGSYIIVEDSHVSGHPVKWKWGAGPYEAIEEFLKSNEYFRIDKECEKLGMTFHPNGYLRRVLHGNS